MCVELTGKLSEDPEHSDGWGAAVHTLSCQSGTENVAIGVPFSETKVAVTQKWAKLPYKAEPEALDTDKRVKL